MDKTNLDTRVKNNNLKKDKSTAVTIENSPEKTQPIKTPKETYTDELELLQKAKENDPESLEILILRYKALVCKIARGYFLVSGGDTDDLIQEGTIGLLKAIREYRADKNTTFTSFAALCINNKVKDVIRSLYRDKRQPPSGSLGLPLEEETTFIAAPNDPYTIYIRQEERKDFYIKAKKLLSPRQLEVLKLYLEGYSYKEIGEKLSVTPKTVDNALSVAKDKIRKSGDSF
ncbi:MAG: sigma-70 family RNA polymerase sigma factor [Clostridia bacterium]